MKRRIKKLVRLQQSLQSKICLVFFLKFIVWWGAFSKGGPIFSAVHFPTGRNCSRNSLVMALSCCSPPRSAIIVQEESSKETRFSRKCAIYFPTYDKSDEMEDVQNELRRKYEIVFKPAVLWPNINFSLRTFTAYYSSSSLV